MKRDYFRVLSMWQPWATLCLARDANGVIAKPDETRAFRPDRFLKDALMPIPIAIHATKSWSPAVRDAAFEFRTWLIERGYSPYKLKKELGDRFNPLPLGKIIGVALIERAVPTRLVFGELDGDRPAGSITRSAGQMMFGDYGDNRFAWVLKEQTLLREPVPFKGKQNLLYPLTGEALDRVWAQL